VGHRQAGLFGERDELLEHVELALVAEVLRPAARAEGVGLLALSVAAGEQALGQRAPDQCAHSGALTDRQCERSAADDPGEIIIAFDGSEDARYPIPFVACVSSRPGM
jgi:hypothetical protein